MKVKDITSLKGVYAGGIAAGIKAKGGLDLAFLYIPNAVASAGVFTRNAFVAAPLLVTKKSLKTNTLKAIIINAGNANAATGTQGLKIARESTAYAAKLLNLKTSEVGVASTGIIGVQLPGEKIFSGLTTLLENPHTRNGHLAARAIMTTDLHQKEIFLTRRIGGVPVSVGGFAKGSGMIAPNMATMLGFLVTDLKIDSRTLQKCLSLAVDASFNMTSVDTDTSTNDMVLVLSSGEKRPTGVQKKILQAFLELLTEACQELAKMIARDGEGATKLLEIHVQGGRTLADSRKIAKSIVNSPLVKTAVHGADPNWGRIIMAVGKESSVRVQPDRVDVKMGGVIVMRAGTPVIFDRKKIVKELRKSEVKIEVDLHQGKSDVVAWGCDLTKGYVDINTAYS